MLMIACLVVSATLIDQNTSVRELARATPLGSIHFLRLRDITGLFRNDFGTFAHINSM